MRWHGHIGSGSWHNRDTCNLLATQVLYLFQQRAVLKQACNLVAAANTDAVDEHVGDGLSIRELGKTSL